jgi:hypothetical protein
MVAHAKHSKKISKQTKIDGSAAPAPHSDHTIAVRAE